MSGDTLTFGIKMFSLVGNLELVVVVVAVLLLSVAVVLHIWVLSEGAFRSVERPSKKRKASHVGAPAAESRRARRAKSRSWVEKRPVHQHPPWNHEEKLDFPCQG